MSQLQQGGGVGQEGDAVAGARIQDPLERLELEQVGSMERGMHFIFPFAPRGLHDRV